MSALLESVREKTDDRFLRKHLEATDSFAELKQHYVDEGSGDQADSSGISWLPRCPILPPTMPCFSPIPARRSFGWPDTSRAAEIAGSSARSPWASMANAAPNAFGAQLAYPGRQTIAICGDGGFTMLGLGDLLTQVERKTPVVHIVLNNESLDFVNIEQQEAGYSSFWRRDSRIPISPP